MTDPHSDCLDQAIEASGHNPYYHDTLCAIRDRFLALGAGLASLNACVSALETHPAVLLPPFGTDGGSESIAAPEASSEALREVFVFFRKDGRGLPFPCVYHSRRLAELAVQRCSEIVPVTVALNL